MKSIKGELKLLFTVCALLLCFAITPNAPNPDRPPTPTKEIQRLDRVLTLSDTQKSEIFTILKKRQAETDALMKNSSDLSATREQMHKLVETSDKEIRALLTEGQRKLFDNMRPPTHNCMY